MERLFNVEEALDFLSKKSKRCWTESEFFNAATSWHIKLRAVVPKEAVTVILEMSIPPKDPKNPLPEITRLPPGHDLLAVLFQKQVAEVWLRGEVFVSHPAGYDWKEGEIRLFAESVRVALNDVRVREVELNEMLNMLNREEALHGQYAIEPLESESGVDAPPKKWSLGLKLVAWNVALNLVKEGCEITSPALWEGMALSSEVKVVGNALHHKKADAKLIGGAGSVKESTVKKDWCGQLKRLFSGQG